MFFSSNARYIFSIALMPSRKPSTSLEFLCPNLRKAIFIRKHQSSYTQIEAPSLTKNENNFICTRFLHIKQLLENVGLMDIAPTFQIKLA